MSGASDNTYTAFYDKAFEINQLFWNPSRTDAGSSSPITKQFVNRSAHEIFTRKLLTDRNILVTNAQRELIPFCEFISAVRRLSADNRLSLYKQLTTKDVLARISENLPNLQTGNKIGASGWTIIIPQTDKNTPSKAELRNISKELLKMAFLVDDLSLAVMTCFTSSFSGNNIDLPWYSPQVIKALNKCPYDITSIPNWMYAQGLPYVDYKLFQQDKILLGFDQEQSMFIVRPDLTGWWKTSVQQFKPAYQNGLVGCNARVDMDTVLNWEEVFVSA